MENKTVIVVSLFGEDSSFDGRKNFRDAVLSDLKHAGLGEHFGGGSWVTNEPNYNIEFLVNDENRALSLIRDVLRASNVGQATELLVGNHRYKVYDDSWTDLGPRPSSPPAKAQNKFAATSSSDLRALLKQIADDARKKYGGPKDPNR